MTENRWISELHWRRAGQQSRSERTQSALLDAAEALIFEKGTEATSIADIAAKAGFSVGAVYHHFKDKKALFLALFDRMTDAYEALNAKASDPEIWRGATVLDLFRGYMEITLNAAREDPAAKAAVSAVVADYPELAAHYAEIQGNSRRALLKLVLARREEIGVADAEEAAAFAIDQISAMLRSCIDPAQRPAALQPIDDETFMRNALRMIAACLDLQPAG
ncbi:TetR/AcrR family transcriptional regulator [Hoeflea sp. WL0058]|uniref:TetR/AcrR family transcriptional regulator n=1 Tax=Flavimaribacter sediminis TaxID=2865987 RepID=A0AAE3D2E0_9HYPH|nr:TetR/AcrR family transcriptional regulator [Flavimaribacter sediminis]MBW8639729.1 TetR/AcrR family transcriptional regulator [Flavimaribacter sediminis]